MTAVTPVRMSDAALSPRQQALIAELFSEPSDDFATQQTHSLHVRQALFTAMGEALQSSLNDHLSRQPQSGIDDRRALAAEVNRCLRSLSLAVKCPRTGRPAILVVDTVDGDHPDVSRFRLQITDDQGRRRRTLTSLELPLPLSLMPALERVEPFRRPAGPAGASLS